jgi:hypothetical protein
MKHEDDLDAKLSEIFRSVERPEPSPGFVSRTMQAVGRESVPAGRLPLRNVWSTAAGWAALIAGVGAAAYGLMVQAVAVELLASFLATGIRAGAWLASFAGAVVAVSDVLATTGRAVARVAATTEGSAALLLMAAAAALSLSALHRLLFVEMEASEWQELS